ncbi:MAG: hypothetical protein K0R10_1358 [Alphaproteobacteria bacterium]|nr:hypothetical protein [Alphaproteobacteria bacterium]
MYKYQKLITIWACILAPIILGFVINKPLRREMRDTAVTPHTLSQAADIRHALEDFKKAYGGLPGDISDAENRIPDCAGRDYCKIVSGTENDGIIGREDFFNTLKPQVPVTVTLPAKTAADETVLFWAQLAASGLIKTSFGSGIDIDFSDIVNGSAVALGKTNPPAKTGGGFIVGYANGAPLPLSLSPKNSGMKGTILVLMSDKALQGAVELNAAGEQAIGPQRAVQIDRKGDDGRPDRGFIQAYGSPLCFQTNVGGEMDYNESVTSMECGLIINIEE